MRAFALKLVACAAALVANASGIALAQSGNPVATPERAAMLVVARPSSLADIFLDVWVKSYTPPRRGAVEAVVSAGPAGGDAVEIGRFTFFPAGPFNAANERAQRAYRFNATALLHRLKPGDASVMVQVALISTEDKISSQGAALTLGKAAFSPRP